MTCPPTLFLVSQSSNLTFPTPHKKGFDALRKSTTMWKALWVSLSEKTITTQQHHKSHLVTSRKLFLLDFFPPLREETRLSSPQRLYWIQMWIVLEATYHNIIQNHTSVPWDWQYFIECSHVRLSVDNIVNIVTDLNNVMLTPPLCKVIVAYCTSICRLAIELDGGWLSPPP